MEKHWRENTLTNNKGREIAEAKWAYGDKRHSGGVKIFIHDRRDSPAMDTFVMGRFRADTKILRSW